MKTKNEQLREIERLLSRYDSAISKAYLESIKQAKDSINLSEIQRLIESGNLRAVSEIIESAVVRSVQYHIGEVITGAYIAGGTYAQKIAEANKIVYAFDSTYSPTARFMEGYKAARIRQVSQDTIDQVSSVLISYVRQGENPLTTARIVRDSIGLTARQESAVRNFKNMLEGLDAQALNRRLRDSRFDSTVARAIREGKPLTKKQIARMTQRYRERYLLRRSQTIARTESVTLLNSGQMQYWNQAVANGEVSENQIVRNWIVTPDSKLRDAHAAIPRMNPNGVALNEPFKSPLGNIRYPSDPSASAANRINCRCAVFTKIEV